MDAPTVNRPRPTVRRTEAKRLAGEAREKMREVAKLLDEGQHSTAHHNALLALTACIDVLDAIDGHVEADLREWADLHGENAGQLAAEARGEL